MNASDKLPPDAAAVGTALADHHRQLDRMFESLSARARSGEPGALRPAWLAFEQELLHHLEIEEREMLPEFGRQHPTELRTILRDHDQIRASLLEMGVGLDLHFLRAASVEAFIDTLRDHARREDEIFHPWVGSHVSAARWAEIMTRLA